MNVYENCPEFEGENFKLRKVLVEDAGDLLKVYSDEKAVPFFNGDNCHGDNFNYTTVERMQEAIKFWLWSYDSGYFVRWTIIDKKNNIAVGTIELFHHDDEIKEYDNSGLLRLDLRSDYEKEDTIKEILLLIIQPVFDLFGDKIVTKVKSFATERLAAVKSLGFSLPKQALKGQNEEEFRDYFVFENRKIVINENLLGKCGFYCGACQTYIKGNSLGCMEEHTGGDCFTRDCVIEQNINVCGQCNNFPCETIISKPRSTVLDPQWLQWKKKSDTNR